MKKIDTRRIAVFGIVAAVYVAVTFALGGLAFMSIQFRISEVLVLLCFYKKDYIIPLTLGCAIANLFSPMMAWDLPFGTLATLVSLILISNCKNIYVASLFPVIINGIIVGLELKFALGLPLFLSMVQVSAGEFVCVSVVGIIVFKALEQNKRFMKLIKFGEE